MTDVNVQIGVGTVPRVSARPAGPHTTRVVCEIGSTAIAITGDEDVVFAMLSAAAHEVTHTGSRRCTACHGTGLAGPGVTCEACAGSRMGPDPTHPSQRRLQLIPGERAR